MGEKSIDVSPSLQLIVYDGPPAFDDGLIHLYDGTNEEGALIDRDEIPRLIIELTKLQKPEQSVENLLLDLLGLAASATAHMGHYVPEWEAHYQDLKKQVYTLLKIGESDDQTPNRDSGGTP